MKFYINNLIKKAKTELCNAQLRNVKNSKETWKTVNQLCKKQKTTTINCLHAHGRNIIDEKCIAETLNDYFLNIGPNIAKNSLDPLTYVIAINHLFHFRAFTSDKISNELKPLKMSKAGDQSKFP